MEETGPSIDDYIDILRRRKMLMVFTVPVLLLITVVVTFSLPAIFRAEGTILIQGQEIPEDFVRSTVESQVEEQIERTRQRIMTSSKISELIEKHNLYVALRGKASEYDLANKFRKGVGVQMIEVDVPGQFGSRRANVAFIVSFMDKDPYLAQKVVADLTTLFLEENIKTRVGKADDTALFLQEEADRMQSRVQEIEDQIAKFKIEYGDSLPELLQYNLQQVERIEEQIIELDSDADDLGDQVHNLNMELSNLDPFVEFSSDRGTTITPRQRLMQLKQQYSQLILTYADSHPDIIRLKEEIELAQKSIREASTSVDSEEAVNPVYRRISSRIESTEKEIARMRNRRVELENELKDYNERIVRTHQVQRNYDEMTRDYNNKLEKYQELRSKQLEANIAQNMEAENKAGSFKLIEPPTVPIKPVKPERLKLLVLGFILSFGAGAGLMLAAEFLDSGVRGVSKVSEIIGQPPIAVVNHIYNTSDKKIQRDNIIKLLWLALAFCSISVLIFQFFVMPFDVLFMKIMSAANMI